jgi:hypothetical protein
MLTTLKHGAIFEEEPPNEQNANPRSQAQHHPFSGIWVVDEDIQHLWGPVKLQLVNTIWFFPKRKDCIPTIITLVLETLLNKAGGLRCLES